MIYSEQINRILTQLEIVYGAGMSGEDYTSASLEDCLEVVFEDLNVITTDAQYISIHSSAKNIMSELSYIASEVYYDRDAAVLFDNFPNTPDIAKILLTFSKSTYSDSITESTYKSLIAQLMFIDAERIEYKPTNAYRCIKLVIMMLMYRSVVHASILSRFIIHQMGISAGLK